MSNGMKLIQAMLELRWWLVSHWLLVDLDSITFTFKDAKTADVAKLALRHDADIRVDATRIAGIDIKFDHV